MEGRSSWLKEVLACGMYRDLGILSLSLNTRWATKDSQRACIVKECSKRHAYMVILVENFGRIELDKPTIPKDLSQTIRHLFDLH